jgi:outer membrane receptor for ferrienterochelin and colicin
LRKRSIWLAAGLAIVALPAFSQTNPTGTISGRLTDQQGLAMAGASVTVDSPALQGSRSVVTSSNGDYVVPFLPPGDYKIKFELAGFQQVERTVRISPSQTQTVNATMTLTTVSETVTVTAEAGADFNSNAPVASSYKKELVDSLPLRRDLNATALLAPGVQGSGPNGGLMVNGAVSYESLYLIDGVVVNENIRGQANTLFIEDALQETTITTAAVSAEFGRFQGGVVNSVTKSGGNDFSGSFRTTIENNDWVALTPYPNDKRTNKIIPTYEATLGGPIFKDRLWFFGAGRWRTATTNNTTFATNINYDNVRSQDRYEGKLTWSVTPNHTFKGAYTKIPDSEQGNSFGNIMDLASLVNRQTPQDLLSTNYTGIISPKFFVEAQYSRRRFTFIGSGSQYRDLIKGTLLLDQSRNNARYNSPTFCGVCDPENRDNQNIIGKATYFLSTGSAGSHNIVAGFDMFDDKRKANNHQSGSDYRVFSTSAILQGDQVFPVFQPSTTFIRWTPIFVSSEGNKFRTISGFINDSWILNHHWTFNVGLRYDKNDGTDQSGSAVVKDSAFSPRLSATFDPKGNGQLTVNAAYAQYVAAIANSVGDAGSAGGQPATIDFDYLGPAVNVGNPSNPVSSADALTTLFNWFNANGGTSRPTRGAPSLPGVNTKIGDRLASPNSREFTIGITHTLGSRGSIRLDGIFRKFHDFYSVRTDLSTGQVKDQFGRSFDLQVTENSNVVERSYKGMNLQVNFRPVTQLNLAGNYTLGHLTGSIEGENGGSGPVRAGPQFYPEYFNASWNYPKGDLLGDVRHRLRLWAVWELPVPKGLGRFTLSPLFYYNSGTPYFSQSTLIDSRPFVTNPGYATPPSSVTYYFQPRDQYRMASLYATDVALNWSHSLGYRKSELFFRARGLNIFGRDGLTNFFLGDCGTGGCIDTTIQTNRSLASLLKFNPFTTTPIEGVNWRKGPSYGKPTSRFAYQTPRTFDFSVGFRF